MLLPVTTGAADWLDRANSRVLTPLTRYHHQFWNSWFPNPLASNIAPLPPPLPVRTVAPVRLALLLQPNVLVPSLMTTWEKAAGAHATNARRVRHLFIYKHPANKP